MTSRPSFDDVVGDWLRRGPTDAPAPLLDAVLDAVPTTPQRRAAWRGPRRSPSMFGTLRTFAAAAIAVVLGAAVLAFLVLRPVPGGVGDRATQPPSATASSSASPSASATPSPSPVASASASPAPTVTPSPVLVGCAATDLRAQIVSWEGAAGHRIANITLTNASASACTVAVMARPQLIDGRGTVLIDGLPPTGSATLLVVPGGILKTQVQDGNYCGAAPAAPVRIRFIEAGGTRYDAAPPSPTDVTVPPCLSTPGSAGDIQMKAWAR